MNSAQRQKILDEIVRFQNSDFNTPFQKKYQNTETIDTIVVSDYSIAELFTMASLAVSSLYDFLENGNWKIVPCDNVTLPLYGNITLSNVIVTIRNHFNNASYEQAAQSIKALVYYEMRCGIWQPKRSRASINKSLLELEKKIELSLSHAKAREDKVENLILELNGKLTEVTNLISAKKREFETLKNNQIESTSILTSIRNVQNSANNIQKSISESDIGAKAVLTRLNEAQNQVNEQIATNKSDILEIQKSLDNFNNDSKEKISKIAFDYEQVSSHADEVKKMMFFIKDGTLAHSFNSRKKTIQKSVNLWGWLTLVGAILLGVWIWCVFAYLQTNIAEGTQYADSGIIIFASLIINIGKLSPMVILLWFILAQYKKERHLLEEYAYREAVAVTLTSYLEQLEGEKDDKKCTLLMNTVEKLYSQPRMVTEKGSAGQIKYSDFKETLNSLVELLNSVQSNLNK